MAKRTAEFVFVGDAKSVIRAAKQAEDAVTKTEAATKRADAATKKSAAATERAHKSMRVSYAETARSAAKFAATSVGIYGVGAALAKVASETIAFDKSMRNVNSLAQLSETRLKGLSDQVLKLAGNTAQAPDALAKGLYDLVSSGFDAKESMLILASSAKAATAGLTSTEISTKAVAAVLNAYHKPAAAAAGVSDTLFQIVNKGVISFEQLSSTIGDVLPFASSLGISLKEVGASAATLTKAGISPEETMTRIKNVMVTLLKPGDALQAAFKKLGVESGEALVKQKGFQGSLEAVLGTTNGTKAAVAALFPNIRSMGGALALTGKNATGAEADLASFKNVTGATDKALSQQSKSISYQWNKVKAVFSATAIEVGSKYAPQVGKALAATAKFVRQMSDGTGQGGRFADKLKEIWGEVKPVVTWVGRATKNVAEFTAEHDNVRKLAEAVLGVGVAVKTLKFVSAKSGFTDLLRAGRSMMRKLVAMFAAEGAVAGEAAGTAAAGSKGMGSGKVNAAIRASGTRSGRAFGKAFGVVAAAVAIYEVADALNKGGINETGSKDYGKGIVGSVLRGLSKIGNAPINLGGKILGITPKKKAVGGLINGVGRGDTVPAMLEPGEFVIRRKVVEQFGPTFFAGLNGGMGAAQGNRQVPGFTSGGIVSRANKMDSMDLPYLWGGGHGGSINRGVDCSGAVSYALGVSPRVSGAFMSYGKPGPGSPNDTKVYASPAHVFAVFNGRGWGTSHENPGGGPGWLSYNSRSGMTVRHLEDSAGSGGTGDPQESASREALQAKIDANLGQLDTLRNRLAGIPTTKAHKAQRKALSGQIRALVSSNRTLRGDIRGTPTAEEIKSSQERSGSRLFNKIAAPFTKGIGAATRGAAALGAGVEDAGTAYGQVERLFGQSEEDLGTPGGRAHRVGEIAALAIMKKKTLADQKKRGALLKRAITKTTAELKKLRAARDKQKGPKRAKMSERIKPVVGRLDDLRAELHSLSGEIVDTQLDIGDLQKEAGEVAKTEDTEDTTVSDTQAKIAQAVSDIDLMERAGLITPDQAASMRVATLTEASKGRFGALDQRGLLGVLADLGDASKAQAEAAAQAAAEVSANTQALRDLQAEVAKQNAIAGSIIGIQLGEAQRVIGDMFSNQIGTRTANRSMMPGSGTLSRL
jgi:TP901 family phage tail tape measure protein